MKPILFNTEMVKAILEGRKTETRRPMKPQPEKKPEGGHWWASKIAQIMVDVEDELQAYPGMAGSLGPFGKIGDRLYVRETHAMGLSNKEGVAFKASSKWDDFEDGSPEDFKNIKWNPSIHMPKWAARIFLEITAIRVERVQDITEEGAEAEGLQCIEWPTGIDYRRLYGISPDSPDDQNCSIDSFYEAFSFLWTSIYPGSWDRNEWVWVVEFKRVDK